MISCGVDFQMTKQNDAFTLSAGTFLAVSSAMLALVLIGRASFVFPLANILNCLKKRDDQKIGFRTQFIIWWAGLMRGAVTVALSYNAFSRADATMNERSLMITSTIIVVLCSTLLFGSVTKSLIGAILGGPTRSLSDVTDIPSLEYLDIPFLNSIDEGNGDNADANVNINDTENDDSNHYRGGSFRLLMRYPHRTVHHIWRKFDNKFMRPYFGGRGFVPYEPGSPTGVADPINNHEF